MVLAALQPPMEAGPVEQSKKLGISVRKSKVDLSKVLVPLLEGPRVPAIPKNKMKKSSIQTTQSHNQTNKAR
jgi:hypothetical protein